MLRWKLENVFCYFSDVFFRNEIRFISYHLNEETSWCLLQFSWTSDFFSSFLVSELNSNRVLIPFHHLRSSLVMDYVSISIVTNLILSITSYLLVSHLIPRFIDTFLQAKRFGVDVHKRNRPRMLVNWLSDDFKLPSSHLLMVYWCSYSNCFRPESFGVVTGCVFLITWFIFLPIHYSPLLTNVETFPHNEVIPRI